MIKAASVGKLPKLRSIDKLKNHAYNMSPSMQSMYYRVANSYLKGHSQINIVGRSMA